MDSQREDFERKQYKLCDEEDEKENMSKFIDIHHIKQEHDILPKEGHNSSLHVCLDGLKVLGVLPHGGKIEPKTIGDADALIEWLIKWIQKKGKIKS